ncbi:MAG: hypothetical protein NTU89_04250 [Candidatus Dependentiae bacterium]|nr:hypothetical protein [Candidatus Dependentiae bacterium]
MKSFYRVVIVSSLIVMLYNPHACGSLANLFASLGDKAPAADAAAKAATPGIPAEEAAPAPEAKMPAPEAMPETKMPAPEAMPEAKMPAPEAMPEAKVMPIAKVGMPKVAPMPTPIPAPGSAVVAKVQSSSSSDSGDEDDVVDVHAITTTGLDTLNVDSAGNWLEKRIWYKKGEQLFESIRSSVQKAADLRMKFVNEVNSAGKKIDEFYETVGLQEGKIEELLKAVLQDLDQAAKYRGGDLSDSERALKTKVQAEQKQIEVVGKDLKLIDDLDEQIDKTMMKAFKEIDSCRGLETRAWNNFKDIGNELDDKKARVLYYEMDNFSKNIEQKMTYLQSNLLPYLQTKLVGKVDETITQIQTNVATLHTKGIDLQTLLLKDEQGDLLIIKNRVGEQEKIAEGSWESAQALKEKEAQELKAQKKKQKQEAENNIWYRKLACSVYCGAQVVWTKVSDWITILVCCVKCLVCKFQELICRLFGY